MVDLRDNPFTAGCTKASDLRKINPVDGSRVGIALTARAIEVRFDPEQCGIEGRWYEERLLTTDGGSSMLPSPKKSLRKITLEDL
jgi:hypothetical protein